MKKTSSLKTVQTKGKGELHREYRFDYGKARPNRYSSIMKGNAVAVVLDEDVAAVFRSTASVNKALRSIITAFPKELRSPSRSG